MKTLRQTTVNWHDCKTDPPDDETTVLVFLPLAEGDPVVLAYKDGDNWHPADALDICRGEPLDGEPTLWCHIPHPEYNER